VTAGTNGDRELIGMRELDASVQRRLLQRSARSFGASRIEHPIPKSTGELVALFAWAGNFRRANSPRIFLSASSLIALPVVETICGFGFVSIRSSTG